MITPDGYRILSQHILQGHFVIELGDQLADWSEDSGKQRADRLIEDTFNCTVLSIDIHGKNHSLALDLNQTLIQDWAFNANIVTDFGTIEHTDDIYQSLKTVHQFLIEGGISIHANPDRSYDKHGNFYFTEQFWRVYAELIDAKVLYLQTIPVYVKSNPMHEIYCVLKHSGGFKYPLRSEFDKACGELFGRW